MQSQISPSTKRQLRDIHLKLTEIDMCLFAMVDRASPLEAEEMGKLEKKLQREIKRIYTILDPPHRR